MAFHKNDKLRIAQRKRRERERESVNYRIWRRESGCGGENQTEGTTEREISRKRSLEILSPNWP